MRKSFWGKSAVIILSVLAVIIGLSSCEKKSSSPSSKPSVVSTSETKSFAPEAISQPQNLGLSRGFYHDVALSPAEINNEEQAHFLRDVLEGLVIYDERGNIIPAVAESWQTQDNKLWIFHLRKNAKWSNGEAVTAFDFVRSWQKLAQSVNPLKNYLQFMNIKNAKAVLEGDLPVEQLGVQAKNDNTLLIQLDKPTPYLPKMLVHASLLPQYLEPHEEWIGNGAYQITIPMAEINTSNQSKVELSQNPYYWNKSRVHFPHVTYQKLQNNTALETLDLVFNPKTNISTIHYLPQLCSYFYEFNLKDPQLAKLSVRKGLASLISVNNIVKNEVPHSLPATNLLPKSLQGDWEREWESVVAEQMFSQQGISEKSPLQIKITYDNQPVHAQIANQIIRQLSQSDLIRVEADPVSWQQLQEKRNSGDFQLIRSGWCADYNDLSAFLSLFYSKSPDNKIHFADEQIDKWFEAAMKSKIEKERSDLYTKMLLQLQKEYLVLPIFQYTTPVYYKANLVGIDWSNPIGVIYSKDLYRNIHQSHTNQ